MGGGVHPRLILLTTTHPICMCFSFWPHLSYTTHQAPTRNWVGDPSPLLSPIWVLTSLPVKEVMLLMGPLLAVGVGLAGCLWLSTLNFFPKAWHGVSRKQTNLAPLLNDIIFGKNTLHGSLQNFFQAHLPKSKIFKSRDSPMHPSGLSLHSHSNMCIPWVSQPTSWDWGAPVCLPRMQKHRQ